MHAAIIAAMIAVAAPSQPWRTGLATWYHPKEKHVLMYGTRMLAAHRTIRPTTRVIVQNVRTKSEVIVTICGYGPAAWTGKQIDLSQAAFAKLAPTRTGVLNVRYRIIGGTQ